MTEIKLTKRYPLSRTEDITDAYMRGWNDALDAVQNGKFHIAEQTEPSDKDINVPNKTEPTTEDCEMVETMSCQECKYHIIDPRYGAYCTREQDEQPCQFEWKTDCPWK